MARPKASRKKTSHLATARDSLDFRDWIYEPSLAILPEYVLPRHDRALLAPGAGDLIVFNGGWHAHWIEPVASGERWTIGGFASLARDRSRVLLWS